MTSGVGHIKSSDYKKKLKGQFGSLEKAANQVHAKIADAKAKLSQGISLGGGRQEALATLDRMSAIADKIEARSRPFEARVKAFVEAARRTRTSGAAPAWRKSPWSRT